MPSSSRNEATATALGFISVWNKPGLGHIGGYLLLNAQARPVEFHCTAPVTPNRAQEILNGTTLQSHLYGERIGVALVERAKQPPQLLVTDCTEILLARNHYDLPILLVASESSAENKTTNAFTNTTMFGFTIEGLSEEHSVAISSNHRSDQQAVEAFCKSHPQMDWVEPFERIREAISEAQRPAA